MTLHEFISKKAVSQKDNGKKSEKKKTKVKNKVEAKLQKKIQEIQVKENPKLQKKNPR